MHVYIFIQATIFQFYLWPSYVRPNTPPSPSSPPTPIPFTAVAPVREPALRTITYTEVT